MDRMDGIALNEALLHHRIPSMLLGELIPYPTYAQNISFIWINMFFYYASWYFKASSNSPVDAQHKGCFNSIGIKVSLAPVKCWAGINVTAPQSGLQWIREKTENNSDPPPPYIHKGPVATATPPPGTVECLARVQGRRCSWSGWSLATGKGGGGVVPLLTKHSHLGIEPKSPDSVRIGLMDRPTGGLQGRRGWGPETRGSQVSEMFLCTDAALWGTRWLVQEHWEEIKAWILNVKNAGLRDASSPGNSVTAHFSSKENCTQIHSQLTLRRFRFDKRWPRTSVIVGIQTIFTSRMQVLNCWLGSRQEIICHLLNEHNENVQMVIFKPRQLDLFILLALKVLSGKKVQLFLFFVNHLILLLNELIWIDDGKKSHGYWK